MNALLLVLLLQSLPLPPRAAMENPAVVSQVPQKAKRDYDKLWAMFLSGKDDAKLARDLDKFLKKQKNIEAAVTIQAYIDLYQRQENSAVQRLTRVLATNPANPIALYYLAELAFAHEDYRQAGALYSRLLAADPARVDVEGKRQKALLLGTEDLLRSAANAEKENRLPEAEQLYRQAVAGAPDEPVLHGRLAYLLAEQKKWDEAQKVWDKRQEKWDERDKKRDEQGSMKNRLLRPDEIVSVLMMVALVVLATGVVILATR